jgi:hypothetical protein
MSAANQSARFSDDATTWGPSPDDTIRSNASIPSAGSMPSRKAASRIAVASEAGSWRASARSFGACVSVAPGGMRFIMKPVIST